MSTVLLYSASDYSSLFSDSSHPPFISRSLAIVDEAIASGDLRPLVRANIDYFRQGLLRLEQMSVDRGEIYVGDGVSDVAFGTNGLLITSPGLNLYQVGYPDLERVISSRKPLNVVGESIGTISGQDSSLSQFWVGRNGDKFVLQNDVSLTAIGVAKKSRRSAPELNDLPEFHRWQGPEPADYAVFVDDRNDSFVEPNLEILSVENDRIRARRTFADLSSDLNRLGVPFEARFEPAGRASHTGFVSVFDRAGAFFGVADLNLSTLELTRFTRLTTEGGATPVWGLLVVPTASGDRRFLLSDRPGTWSASEVFSENSAVLVGSGTLLDRELSPDVSESLRRSSSVGSRIAVPLSAHSFMVGFRGDSVWVVDFVKKTVELLYHPGDAVRYAVSTRGYIAFYVSSSRRLFVLRVKR